MWRKVVSMLVFGVFSVSALPAVAAPDRHEHSQHAATTALRLDHGKKWQTDAPLRTGMSNIRNRLDRHLRDSHAKTAGNADYLALAGDMQREVDAIFAQCHLSPDADAVLHVILSDMLHATAALKGEQGQAARSSGVTRATHALHNYATYFDHPNWAPPTHH